MGILKNLVDNFSLSRTFGTKQETEKDRIKRELAESMPPLLVDDEIIVVDPDAETKQDIGLSKKETNILKFMRR